MDRTMFSRIGIRLLVEHHLVGAGREEDAGRCKVASCDSVSESGIQSVDDAINPSRGVRLHRW